MCPATTNARLPKSFLIPTHNQDEVTRYRAVLRSQNLFNKNHSVTHNIITGEARPNPVPVPPAPHAPQR